MSQNESIRKKDGLKEKTGIAKERVIDRLSLLESRQIEEIYKSIDQTYAAHSGWLRRPPTPGTSKSGKSGQLPRFPGSPPMRIQWENDGVGPSRMNIWNQPDGAMKLFGGAVTVHVLPVHENSGKSVRMPIALPVV